MRLITTNDQLCSLLPNIMSVVKGERQLIDKIVPFIDASERWLIGNFVPDEIFNVITGRPDNNTVKVTMARIVAFDAFRSAVPHLDLILTPNGFGIVNNSNIAPASKERVERLINSLLDNRDNEIQSLQGISHLGENFYCELLLKQTLAHWLAVYCQFIHLNS